jgi:hypothetical protein
MTWVAVGVAGASLVTSIVGGSRARKQQQKALMGQQIAEQDAARRQAADFAGQVEAANAARLLAAEREVLSDQAESEAIRQARLASVETDVTIATVDATERNRRRRAFQEGNAV